MGKFKVGDKVRVREWDDMKKEFGGDGLIIPCRCGFVGDMKELCGKVFYVKKVRTEFSYNLDGEASGWAFSDDMLYPAITYREYMKENHPDCVGPNFIAGVLGCPRDKGFRDFSCTLQCGNNCKKCEECWDQYMTEAEYKKYVLKEEGEKEMFKVGDYVKVVKPVGGRTVSWVRTMDWTVGKVFKISKVDSDNTCQLEGTDSVWFPFEALEPATPKDMLSPLCTARLRNGNVYLFTGENHLVREHGFLSIENHDKNLNASLDDEYDVMDICAPSNYITELSEFLTNRGECIWKREEVVEITAEEAAKKLSEQYPGQTVKIVC